LLGFVAIGTGSGAILGMIGEAVLRPLVPGLAGGTISAAAAILGFAFGWWWAVTVGQRWLDEDDTAEE
jgi:hypothetical protein